MSRVSYFRSIYLLIFALLFVSNCTQISNTSTDAVNYWGNRTENENKPEADFLIVFADTHGIYKVFTKNDSTVKIFDIGDLVWNRTKASPDENYIAFVYKKDSLRNLAILDIDNNSVTDIQSIPLYFNFFSFDWSQDSRKLGVGYYDQGDFFSDSKPKKGDLFIYDITERKKRSIGCTISRIFGYFLPDGNVLVEGPWNVYIVDTSNCKTIGRIDMSDKRYLTLSPKGDKIFYLKDQEVYLTNKGINTNIPQLFMADTYGKNEQLIYNYKNEPKHPEWSADGTKIVCDIASPDWGGERNTAIYNLNDGIKSYYQESDISVVWDPHWSPDGTKIVYDKQTPPFNHVDNLTYYVRSIVVYNLKTDRAISIRKVIDPSETAWIKWSGPPLGETWGWVENEYVVIHFPVGTWIYNLVGEVVDSLPLSKPLYVRKIK